MRTKLIAVIVAGASLLGAQAALAQAISAYPVTVPTVNAAPAAPPNYFDHSGRTFSGRIFDQYNSATECEGNGCYPVHVRVHK